MVSDENKRDFTRARVLTQVEFATADGQTLQGTARDISMSGLFLQTFAEPPTSLTSATGEVRINLPGATESYRIYAHGSVVRVDADGVAIEFKGMDDESLEHLKKLVLYNASDVHQVEDEIEDSLGLRRRKESFGDF